MGKNQAKPFVKWAGGKGQLLDKFGEVFPEEFNTYYEPMVGAGAVFFELNPEKAVINDINEDLIKTYGIVRDEVNDLIEILKEFEKLHDKEFYYQKRGEFNLIKKENNPDYDLDLAARFIYLNRTCFNGLYRVNSSGEFNVPMGSYKNPTICNEELLRVVSDRLQDTEIMCGDFKAAVESAGKDDLIYFDPPYDPVSKTSNFTEYTNGGFGDEDQKRLAKTFKKLSDRGVRVALSNSDTDFIRRLYKDFKIQKVKASRSINCKSKGRGDVDELIVTNF